MATKFIRGFARVSDNDSFIFGSNRNDTILFSGHDNFVFGGDGNDTIIASASSNNNTANGDNNYLSGGAGNDTIATFNGKGVVFDGGTGNDRLTANYGNQIVMNGGAGDDKLNIIAPEGQSALRPANFTTLVDMSRGLDVLLTGDSGNDTFSFLGAGKRITSVTNSVITDFNVADDKLSVKAVVGSTLTSIGHGQLNVAFDGTNTQIAFNDVSAAGKVLATQYITLVGIDQNEWSLVQVV